MWVCTDLKSCYSEIQSQCTSTYAQKTRFDAGEIIKMIESLSVIVIKYFDSYM